MAKKKRRKNRTPGKKVLKKTGKGTPKPAARLAPASTGELARALDLLRWTHATTVAMLDSFPEGRLTFGSFPGENHALWTMGHLITGYAWWTGMLGGTPAPYPESYNPVFGYKSTPSPDPSRYPHPAEVRRHLDAAWDAVMRAAVSLSEADGLKPPATESGGFAKTRLEAIYKLVWHEGWHQGQLSTLRRALGLPPVL